jgi:hypothetical protein
MTNAKFKRAARINKTKAVLLTVTLHIVIIGGISGYGNGSISDIVPEKVKTFLGWEEDTPATKNTDDEVALRP